MNTMTVRALNRTLYTTSDPLFQIQINYTKCFLLIKYTILHVPYTAQMIPLCSTNKSASRAKNSGGHSMASCVCNHSSHTKFYVQAGIVLTRLCGCTCLSWHSLVVYAINSTIQVLDHIMRLHSVSEISPSIFTCFSLVLFFI